jgi:hypothetical protein
LLPVWKVASTLNTRCCAVFWLSIWACKVLQKFFLLGQSTFSNLWIMKYHKAVAWNLNTEVGPLNEPNFTFPTWNIFPFNKYFSTGSLSDFLFDKHCTEHNAVQLPFIVISSQFNIQFQQPRICLSFVLQINLKLEFMCALIVTQCWCVMWLLYEFLSTVHHQHKI